MPDAPTRDGARAACRSALEQAPDLQPLWRAHRDRAPRLAEAIPLVRHVGAGHALVTLAAIRRQLGAHGLPVGDGAFERFLVVATALDTIDEVARLPVDDHVKKLFYKKFTMYASALREPLSLDDACFVAASGIVSLKRFPAGQLDWVLSGVPRSWLLRVPRVDLPRLVKVITLNLGGFAPTFFTHLDAHRPNQGVLLERESLRSYHRIARSMALQPAVKGVITASWFHSPDTFAVSPHLRWANDVFLQHGGHLFSLGPADRDCGVLQRSPERQRAYDSGTFIPSEALVIWPRRAVLAWAEQRPDLEDAPADRVTELAGARA